MLEGVGTVGLRKRAYAHVMQALNFKVMQLDGGDRHTGACRKKGNGKCVLVESSTYAFSQRRANSDHKPLDALRSQRGQHEGRTRLFGCEQSYAFFKTFLQRGQGLLERL
jgi:hypothetical protein